MNIKAISLSILMFFASSVQAFNSIHAGGIGGILGASAGLLSWKYNHSQWEKDPGRNETEEPKWYNFMLAGALAGGVCGFTVHGVATNDPLFNELVKKSTKKGQSKDFRQMTNDMRKQEIEEKSKQLSTAIANCDSEGLKELLSNEYRLNTYDRDLLEKIHEGLLQAIRIDWLEGVSIFINNGAHIWPHYNHLGNNPLIEAAELGKTEVVKLLTEQEHQPNLNTYTLKNFVQHNALSLAAQNNHKEIVRRLLQKRADATVACDFLSANPEAKKLIKEEEENVRLSNSPGFFLSSVREYCPESELSSSYLPLDMFKKILFWSELFHDVNYAN